jgi:hypothetical protein
VVEDRPSTGWAPLREAGWRARVVPRGEKEQAFYRLAVAHALSAAGDAMVTVSLAGTIFFTTSLNGARPKLVLSLLLTMAPFAVVAPFLGPAIDRSRGGRRLMIVASAVGRAVVCLYMATVVHGLLLYPCALALLVLSKSYSVAKSALVPATIDNPAQFVKANSRLAVIATVAGLLASLPAALVWKVFDASWSLRLAAVVYAVMAVMAVRIRPAPPAEMEPPDNVDAAVRSRGVSLASTCMITLRACSGFLTFAVAFVFRRTGAPAYWYGLVGACALAGGFIGSVLGPRLRNLLAEERILTAALALVSVTAVFAARLDDRAALALLAFMMGLADGVGQLSFDAIVQRDGSEGARARSFARFEASFQIAWVGAALVPVIVPVPLWVAAITMAAATGASAVTYVIGRHTAPRDALVPPVPVPALVYSAGAGGGAARAPAPADQGVWGAVRPDPLPDRAAAAPSMDDTPPLGTPAVGSPAAAPPPSEPPPSEPPPSAPPPSAPPASPSPAPPSAAPLAGPSDAAPSPTGPGAAPGPRRNPRRAPRR